MSNNTMYHKLKLLIWMFLLIFVAVVLLIAANHFFIKDELLLYKSYVQVILIILLLAVGYTIYNVFKEEIRNKINELEILRHSHKNLKDRLDDAFKYIGSVNVQINEIRSIFSDMKQYPESKKDLRYTLEFFANKILGIINAGWVVIQVIDLNNLTTLTEYNLTRTKGAAVKQNISNKELVDNKNKDTTAITSEQNNLFIKAYCVLPKVEISREQKVFIKAICSRLELLYLIFSSNYYKNSRLNNNP